MSTAALTTWLIGAAWGLLGATPIARRAGRVGVAARVASLSSGSAHPARRARRGRLVPAWLRAHALDPGVRVVTAFTTRRRARAADLAVRREVPVAIDLLAVAVGAGCTPYLAVEVAARWSPAPLAGAFADVLRSCGLGLDFEAALDARARATPALRSLADALLASDRLGVPVGPVLARLADEHRRALRRAAEAHARRIPVRLLFPLVFLVLPAFVVLTVVPGVAAGLGRL
jgi:tight adherence protein C